MSIYICLCMRSSRYGAETLVKQSMTYFHRGADEGDISLLSNSNCHFMERGKEGVIDLL